MTRRRKGTIRCPLGDACPVGGWHFPHSDIARQHQMMARQPSYSISAGGSASDDFSSASLEGSSTDTIDNLVEAIEYTRENMSVIKGSLMAIKSEYGEKIQDLVNKYDSEIEHQALKLWELREKNSIDIIEIIDDIGFDEAIGDKYLSQAVIDTISDEEEAIILQSSYGVDFTFSNASVSNSLSESVSKSINVGEKFPLDVVVSRQGDGNGELMEHYQLRSDIKGIRGYDDNSYATLERHCDTIFDDYKERGGVESEVAVMSVDDGSIESIMHPYVISTNGSYYTTYRDDTEVSTASSLKEALASIDNDYRQ